MLAWNLTHPRSKPIQTWSTSPLGQHAKLGCSPPFARPRTSTLGNPQTCSACLDLSLSVPACPHLHYTPGPLQAHTPGLQGVSRNGYRTTHQAMPMQDSVLLQREDIALERIKCLLSWNWIPALLGLSGNGKLIESYRKPSALCFLKISQSMSISYFSAVTVLSGVALCALSVFSYIGNLALICHFWTQD